MFVINQKMIIIIFRVEYDLNGRRIHDARKKRNNRIQERIR